MKLVFVIIFHLIFIIENCNAVKCIDSFEETSEYFTLTNIKEIVNSLSSIESAIVCRVQIKIDYHNQYVKINFGKSIRASNLIKNRQIRVDTNIKLAQDKINFIGNQFVNIIEFSCDSINDCDRYFVLDQLQWLFEVDYNQLISNIRLLITNEHENSRKKNIHLFNLIILVFINKISF